MTSETDIHPRLQDIVDTWAEKTGFSDEQVVSQLERLYGLDLSEVPDDDAKKFADAVENGDIDTTKQLLKENGVSDDAIEQFEQQIMAQQGDTSGNENSVRENGSDADTDTTQSNDDGMSRSEVREMIRAETPSSQEIVQDLQAELQGGQQGGQQGDGGGGGGMDGQTQSMLAQAIAQQFLGSQGGGQMAQLGEKFQKAAMSSFIKEMQRPSLGDIMERKMYDKIADEEVEQWREEMFEGNPIEELDESEDDDDSDGWSFL